MSGCRRTRRLLSPYMDGDLDAAASRLVAGHLAACVACTARLRSLRSAVDMLAETPRLESPEPIAPRVFDRLEVETRGAGLALILRPGWKARPLILPSLLPAAAVLVVVLGLAFVLDRDPVPLPVVVTPGAESWGPTAASGTENNPLFPSTDVSAPRARTAPITVDLLEGLGESSFFVETVVARDGSVSTVTLLDGDFQMARPLLEALRHERFEPGRRHGRPVAVSLYRLISRLDVFS